MSKYYFVGSGIASLVGAAYLIRDGHVAGHDIVIFEEANEFGGALDAHGDSKTGYFMSGSRMFEHKYNCTADLMSFIPSTSDPTISVNEETDRAELESRWHNKARLVDRHGKITEFHSIGFSERDRVDLLVLMATPEALLDNKRITDCLHDHFFETNLWFEWCTIFAFERWHSAIEFKRYLLRFLHHFSTIDTQVGVYRTRYSQYDSIAVPLVKWLRGNGVEMRFDTVVNDVGFAAYGDDITVVSLSFIELGLPKTIAVGINDSAFVTIGSMTADKTFGSMTTVPGIDRSKEIGLGGFGKRSLRVARNSATLRCSTATSRNRSGSLLPLP